MAPKSTLSPAVRLFSSIKAPGVTAAAVTSAAMIAQQVAGKAARDALFLSSFHAHSLPYAMAGGAALSLVAVVWLSRVMSRQSPARVLPVLIAISTCGLALEWGVGFVSAPVAAVAVYLHTSALSPMMISTFWSLINERFDPHAGKAAVARIASGSTLGGVLGGLAAWRAASIMALPTTVLCLAVLNAACLIGTMWFRSQTDQHRPSIAPATTQATPVSAVAALRTAPYLRNLALLVALGAAISSVLDYIFSAQAEAAFARGAPLLAFFSLFWLSVSVLSFFIQLTLGRIAMEKLGLAVNIAVLPGIVIMGGAFGLAVPGLLSAALLRGAEAIQRNTLFRSAYELLYTPLTEERKRSTKALIDVGFDRVGTVVGSGVALLALHALSRGQATVLLGVVVALGFATLPIARKLQAGYVAALEEGLREGAKQLDLPPVDAQRASVVANRDGAARDELIEHAEELRPTDTSAPANVILADPTAFLSRAGDVLSPEIDRAKRALSEWPSSEPQLATFALLLLAHKELHGDALAALRRVAPRVTGQLVDCLLDPSSELVVRRRVARALAASPTQRAADGLLLGVAHDRFEVRYECGRALLKVTEANAEIAISRERVFEAVLREAQAQLPDELATEEYDEDALGADSLVFVESLLASDRRDRRLEHMFTILSLHLEREPLRMAFRALHLDDERHRGTALEYLDTILPSELHDAVWPFLGATKPLTETRAAPDILRDLLRATGGTGRPTPPTSEDAGQPEAATALKDLGDGRNVAE